jgi:cyclic-di-AMP phosphodiesterase PgpH
MQKPALQFLRNLTKFPSLKVLGGLLAVLILTAAFGQNFYTQPQLRVGKMPPQTIHAPGSASLEDSEKTEILRQKARQITPVLGLDAQVTGASRQQIQRILNEGQRLRKMMGKFPFVDPRLLDPGLQRSLLKAEFTEWQAIVSALSDKSIERPSDWQRQTIAALQEYQRVAGNAQLQTILSQITQAKQIYQTALGALQDPVLSESGYLYNISLFELSNADWQTLFKQLPPLADRILTQGLTPGLPKAQQEKAFKLHVQANLPKATQPLATTILLHSLEPNLVPDPDQTEQRAMAAESSVKPVILTVQQGQIIARSGEAITPEQALWLAHFNLDRRSIDGDKFGWFAGLMALVTVVFKLALRVLKIRLKPKDYLLIGLLMLTTALLIHLRVPSTNLPMLGLLLSTFYNPYLSGLTVLTTAFLLPIGFSLGVQSCLSSLVGGLLAAGYSSRLRSREDSVLLGVAVGLAQGLVYLVLGWWLHQPWQALIGGATIYGLLGLAWCIVGLGISPYLERLFDLVTTLRLVELANLNRPLLKRLAAETPGTFQHTLAVANLAEAAARELGCNVELVRTGTLYHDIGKMHDPLGFIENQMGGVNKHDTLNNPWESAKIIRKHITEGIVMAKRSGLPKAVQAFIPEHQGAQLIAYFYHQARKQAESNPALVIDEQDFRYDGPNPQSRETGIVMLADSCEAALRSLGQATPEQAANMMQKIFRARWQDGALTTSGLTRQDLDRIAEIFLQVWQQSNHQRIAYPK